MKKLYLRGKVLTLKKYNKDYTYSIKKLKEMNKILQYKVRNNNKLKIIVFSSEIKNNKFNKCKIN